MNLFERLGRLLVAKVVAFLAVVITLFVVFTVAPAIPVVGPLALEYVRPLAYLVGFLAWVRVMVP